MSEFGFSLCAAFAQKIICFFECNECIKLIGA